MFESEVRWSLLTVVFAVAAAVALPGGGAPPARAGGAGTFSTARPNIVFVLTDDLSGDLIPYMPHVRALARRGAAFGNYFVSDSLCCPSRASIFTGEFPHDTGVFTNAGSDGGIGAFYAHNDEQRTFNLALQGAGYRTAMMGKYLNGYLQGPQHSPVPDTYVPAGWNEWDVAGWGYPEFDYTLNENGTLHRFGHAPRDYLTNVLGRRAAAFIGAARQPFFLEVATFAPHYPYVPAPRDARRFRHLRAPRPPSFDALPNSPPSWLAGHRPLTARQIRRINRAFRRRVQSVQAIDRMVGRIETALAAAGQLDNTYIVFSSDNGLHTGEYRLMPGKLTAFDTDIRVPLIVAGPGLPAGRRIDAMTQNVDLAPTFAALAHVPMSGGDGHSLVPLLVGRRGREWRNAALIEHHGAAFATADPDAQSFDSGDPTTYEAVRTPAFLYVEYADGEREYYDLRDDPAELDNIAASLTPEELARLHRELARLEQCHGAAACWTAAHVGGGG